MLIISILGILAFGPEMADPFNKKTVKYFNYDFYHHVDWIYYYVSLYVFFNIAIIPVAIIVLRNNSMKLLTPNRIPPRTFDITKWTLIYTSAILGLTFALAILLENYI